MPTYYPAQVGGGGGGGALALQLHFSSVEMSAACLSLVGASPEGPRDDMGRLDAAERELDRDTTDFLNRPAD